MSTDCAICYVSDLGFLLPSLVSAASIRQFIPPHKADILIFTVGVDGDKVENSERLLAPRGIRIVPIDTHVFGAFDLDRLSLTYTPLATFGRFFMEDLLPRSCRRVVYLDGDVLCVGDPAMLVDAIVPEGRFAAAEDTIFYRQRRGRGSIARGIRDYLAGLGLHPDNGYFNAGVFAVARETWKVISREAYAYFLKNTESCKHFDQSALNAVVRDRRLRLSAKWNFQTQLKIWKADRFVVPHICHFNRYPKPWMGVCEPWKELYSVYQLASAQFVPLELPVRALSATEVADCNAMTRNSYSYLRLPFVSRAALRYMDFDSIERSAWI
jgi:lipopolysaccharide biosynthesis glycosyltransferase